MLTDPCAHPAYLRLGHDALASRAHRAVATLADCRACPRDCGVNRLEDRWAACKTGRYAVVSSFFPHFGEEDCLRGWDDMLVVRPFPVTMIRPAFRLFASADS